MSGRVVVVVVKYDCYLSSNGPHFIEIVHFDLLFKPMSITLTLPNKQHKAHLFINVLNTRFFTLK